jgi:hypothetical protein
MKKYFFTIIATWFALSGAMGQNIVRIDTVLKPYIEFDYQGWLDSDPQHPLEIYNNGIMYCYGGMPQIPFEHLDDSIRENFPVTSPYLYRCMLSGEQIQYNYIEGGATVHGIAYWYWGISDTFTVEPHPINDLLLYEATPDTLMLLERVPALWFGPPLQIGPRLPLGRGHSSHDCQIPLFDGGDDTLWWRPQYQFFDKPVRVEDSFYVGASQTFQEYSARDNWTQEGGSYNPTLFGFGWMSMAYHGQHYDPSCWPPPMKIKQRWTFPEWLENIITSATGIPLTPRGYIRDQWINRYALDFFLILPIIETYDTLWDYELPQCPQVEWFNVTGRAGDTTIIRWQSADMDHSEWQLSYGPVGIDPNDGTMVDLDRCVWRYIDSLHTGDSMSAWVRTVCRDEGFLRYSEWSHPVRWCSEPSELWTERPNSNIRLDGLVRLTPNPTSDQATVTSAYRLTGVEVYAMDGRLLYKTNAQGLTCTFSVREWPQGSYVVLVQTAAGTSTKKLLVQP